MTNPNRYTEIKRGEVRILTGTSSHLDDDVVLGTELIREAEITASVNLVMTNYISYLYAVSFLTGKPPIMSINDDNST